MHAPVHVRALILSITHLMVMMTATVAGLNVALPDVMEDLDVDVTLAVWVVLGYFVAFPAASFSGGLMSTFLNKKKLILIGLAGDVVMCVLIFFAPSISLIIIARFIQGLFRIFPWLILQVMAVGGFSPGQRGKVLGLTSMGTGLATMISFPLTGFVVDEWGWRWLFLGSSVAFAAFIPAVMLMIPNDEPKAERPKVSLASFDIPGSLLMMTGFVSLLIAFQFIAQGSNLALAVPLGVGGVAAMVAFVWVELRASNPVVQFAVFRIRGALVGATQATVFGLVNGAFLLLVPFLFIQGYGWTAAYASSILFFANVARPSFGLVAGWAADRVGSTRVILPAAMITGAALVLTALLGNNPMVALVSAVLLLWGLGLTFMSTANMKQVFSSLPRTHLHLAPSTHLVMMLLGSMTGQALTSVVVQRSATAGIGQGVVDTALISAISTAMLVLAAVFAIGVVFTQLLPRLVRPAEDAEEVLGRRLQNQSLAE
jgi:MFS family permease